MELPSHEALMSMSSRDREALRAVATPEQNATLDEYTTAREAAELKLGRNSGVAHDVLNACVEPLSRWNWHDRRLEVMDAFGLAQGDTRDEELLEEALQEDYARWVENALDVFEDACTTRVEYRNVGGWNPHRYCVTNESGDEADYSTNEAGEGLWSSSGRQVCGLGDVKIPPGDVVRARLEIEGRG